MLDEETTLRTKAERAVATRLQGSCQVPLAVYAVVQENRLHVTGLVGTPDGLSVLRSEAEGEPSRVDDLSATVAEQLLEQGADKIIASLS